ncbi:MAG: ABC transporter permease [Ruminiclostridium sp.]
MKIKKEIADTGKGRLQSSLSNDLGDFLFKRGTAIGMLALIIILGIRSPNFFAITNLMDILKQGGILTLIALSQTIILVAGGFDMSAGALAQLTANLTAGFIIGGHNTFLVLIMCTVIGLAAGLVNAFLVIVVKIPPFVATLGTMFISMGLTFGYNKGKALTLQEVTNFSFLGQGYLGIIPFMFVIVIAVLVILYSVGENLAAAKLRGINQKKSLLIAFLIGGAIVGFTGVLQTSYYYGASAVPTGMDFLISALAAALLGSTYSKTGELSVIGTAISAMFIAALSNGLIVNGVSNLAMPGILGSILVVSIMLTVIKKREIGQVTIF